MTEKTITYHFNPEHFEILAKNEKDEQVGEIEYHAKDQVWNVTHTGVNPDYRGGDIALTLVRLLVEEARKAEVKLSASCPYAVKVLERTEEYQDIYLKK
jgi:predicted GNAT family acetyltransferase